MPQIDYALLNRQLETLLDTLEGSGRGAVTPFGGTALIVGWGLLAWGVWQGG